MFPTNRSKNGGAYFSGGEADSQVVSEWLTSQSKSADGYSDPETFIRAVAEARHWWVVIASAGRALTMPFFDRLLRASIETDTELWTADDNTEFGMHLFCSMMANWDFIAPYVPESGEGTSLTSVRDALSRIEQRIHPSATEIHPDEATPVEDSSITSQLEKGLIVKNGLIIDPSQFTVTFREHKCFLGNTILFGLAASLGRAPGKWFPFGELRDDVWRDHQTEDSTIGRTLRLLRNKLNEAGVTGVTVENSRTMKKHARLMIS